MIRYAIGVLITAMILGVIYVAGIYGAPTVLERPSPECDACLKLHLFRLAGGLIVVLAVAIALIVVAVFTVLPVVLIAESNWLRRRTEIVQEALRKPKPVPLEELKKDLRHDPNRARQQL